MYNIWRYLIRQNMRYIFYLFICLFIDVYMFTCYILICIFIHLPFEASREGNVRSRVKQLLTPAIAIAIHVSGFPPAGRTRVRPACSPSRHANRHLTSDRVRSGPVQAGSRSKRRTTGRRTTRGPAVAALSPLNPGPVPREQTHFASDTCHQVAPPAVPSSGGQGQSSGRLRTASIARAYPLCLVTVVRSSTPCRRIIAGNM